MRAYTRGMRSVSLFGNAVLFLVIASLPLQAQDAGTPDSNPGAITVTAAADGVSTYMFRGIRQNTTGVAIQPSVDVGVSFLSGGTEGLSSVGLNIGTWNSLHSGDTGADAPSGNMWYEQDFYTTLSLGLGATSVATSFTAYTSPNAGFTTVREISFRVAYDDSPLSGRAALRPFGIIAFEFLAEPGVGQADGGEAAGTYLELGIAPAVAAGPVTLALPVRLGMSLSNYYELRGPTGSVVSDQRFGYFSVTGFGSVPLGQPSRFGAFNLHGGIEYQRLGDTTRAFNGGDQNKAIWSFGLGMTY
jgi:hypothetical protein